MPYKSGPNGTYTYSDDSSGGYGGGAMSNGMSAGDLMAHLGMIGADTLSRGRPGPDYGAAGPVVGGSIAGYGNAIGGAMNQIAGLNAANQQAGLSQQQMQVPLQLARINQGAQTQRMGMMAPLLAMLLGRAGGMMGGGQGNPQAGFTTNFGQMALPNGQQGMGGAAGGMGGGAGGGSPADLYRYILAQRQAQELDLNTLPNLNGTHFG